MSQVGFLASALKVVFIIVCKIFFIISKIAYNLRYPTITLHNEFCIVKKIIIEMYLSIMNDTQYHSVSKMFLTSCFYSARMH